MKRGIRIVCYGFVLVINMYFNRSFTFHASKSYVNESYQLHDGYWYYLSDITSCNSWNRIHTQNKDLKDNKFF